MKVFLLGESENLPQSDWNADVIIISDVHAALAHEPRTADDVIVMVDPELDNATLNQIAQCVRAGLLVVCGAKLRTQDDLVALLHVGTRGIFSIDRCEESWDCIRAVGAGACWIAPAFAGFLNIPSPRKEYICDQSAVKLSGRELDVLKLVAEGLSNDDIGRGLGLSSSTVRTYLRTIMEKMAARDRTDAAVKALRAGLL